ncbi:peptidase inhibitor 16 [Caerostris extrusa]|uniref:Peptidase inhibitor 16 n=1 Tax=Caerostris extrusa TaxID=172846 RepID=A0AAV4UHL6_CAEEX|nr:peptidase inhibitor 16 [Caerostris extrusa]
MPPQSSESAEELDTNEIDVPSYPEIKEIVEDFHGDLEREVPERGLDARTKREILILHNLIRANITPVAANMNFMEWDKELEDIAQVYADQCIMDHGKPPNTSYSRGSFGQSLFFSKDISAQRAIRIWYQEKDNFIFKENSCRPGKQCFEYAQMIQGMTNRMGRGKAKCGNGYLTVCHYNPPLYVFHQFYITGKPCSQCSNGNGGWCVSNLCISKEQCERNSKNFVCRNCGALNTTSCECTCADGWDSLDCSRACENAHVRCGVKPGYSESSCSVAGELCRKFCGLCSPLKKAGKTDMFAVKAKSVNVDMSYLREIVNAKHCVLDPPAMNLAPERT